MNYTKLIFILLILFYFFVKKNLEKFTEISNIRVVNDLINIGINTFNNRKAILLNLQQNKFEGDLNITGTLTGKTFSELNNRLINIDTRIANRPPIINIRGGKSIIHNLYSVYNDQGATATDNNNNNLSVETSVHNINADSPLGTYYVQYSATDSNGKNTTATRTVTVEDNNYWSMLTLRDYAVGSYKVMFYSSNNSNCNDADKIGEVDFGECKKNNCTFVAYQSQSPWIANARSAKIVQYKLRENYHWFVPLYSFNRYHGARGMITDERGERSAIIWGPTSEGYEVKVQADRYRTEEDYNAAR